MGPLLIVVPPSGLHFLLCVLKGQEPVLILALLPEAAIESDGVVLPVLAEKSEGPLLIWQRVFSLQRTTPALMRTGTSARRQATTVILSPFPAHLGLGYYSSTTVAWFVAVIEMAGSAY